MKVTTLHHILREKEINLEAASLNILQATLWRTFRKDFTLGVTYLEKLALEVKLSGQRIIRYEQPNSQLGRELAQLLGTDIAREICETRFDIAFGLYDECVPVAAPSRAELKMSPLEQIKIKSGVQPY